jgi:hypothetical protein
MPVLDATAKSTMDGPAFAVAWFVYLDISGDPLRVTTLGKNITFAGTGDSDLDGQTFAAFDGRPLSISNVNNSESGSETLTVELSGIVTIDTSLLADVANVALWQGRVCRMWFQVYDAAGVSPQGAIVPYYTGYMMGVDLTDSPKNQSIRLSVENYLAAFSQASNRSYLNQKDYDAADTSAAATMAAANGARKATAGGAGGMPGLGAISGGYGSAVAGRMVDSL